MDNATLMRKLREDGSVGADLSPGDPVAAAAFERIGALEATLRSIFTHRDIWTSDEWDAMERLYCTAPPESQRDSV